MLSQKKPKEKQQKTAIMNAFNANQFFILSFLCVCDWNWIDDWFVLLPKIFVESFVLCDKI